MYIESVEHMCIISQCLLWWSGAAPLDYVRFLDYSAELTFLRKVGGGFIFIHRLLMEHFASLYDKPVITDENTTVPQ